MATLDRLHVHRPPVGRALLAALLRRGWDAAERRRERRALALAAARLGPRLARDAGVRPADIEAAEASGWDRLEQGGLRLLLPR
jgi:uncharacterized protein YjiS (DUF1127 family)